MECQWRKRKSNALLSKQAVSELFPLLKIYCTLIFHCTSYFTVNNIITSYFTVHHIWDSMKKGTPFTSFHTCGNKIEVVFAHAKIHMPRCSVVILKSDAHTISKMKR